MVKDRLEENKRSIAFAKKLQRWADGVGLTFISNMCEDYLAQFTDEKYEVLEGTPIYKLFTGKEQEAVFLGKIIHVNHHNKGELMTFRGYNAFCYIVEGKIAMRYKTSVKTLVALNDLKSKNLLRLNQRLLVPTLTTNES